MTSEQRRHLHQQLELLAKSLGLDSIMVVVSEPTDEVESYLWPPCDAACPNPDFCSSFLRREYAEYLRGEADVIEAQAKHGKRFLS